MTPENIGRFEVTGRLGAGGMGVVYEGRDPRLNRRVALKLLPWETRDDGEGRMRFLREARTAAAVSHANIVVIYEVDADPEHGPYIALELIEGPSLRERLAEPVSMDEALGWLRQIAAGLAAAHEAGLVHRDLKPANVLLTKDGTAKVADFGLAKAIEGHPEAPLTGEGTMMGSPGYMSPEQARGASVDQRADVYAFGVLIHELVAGQRPFGDSASPMAEVLAALERPIPDLAERAPRAPDALVALARRCLSTEAEQRPADGAALVSALASISAGGAGATAIDPYGETVSSAPAVETAPPRASRRPLAIAIGAAVLLGVVGVGAYFATRPAATENAPPAEPSESWEPPRGLASSDPRGPLLVHCYDRGPACAEGSNGWCDRDGERVACCVPGLVPTADGFCECPPGGTDRPELVDRGCDAVHDDVASRATIGETLAEIAPDAEACLEGTDATEGRVRVRAVITPHGDLFDVSIEESSVPSAEAQRCLLDRLRASHWPVTADGAPLELEYPFILRVTD